jgi:hypothetical protein
MTKEQELFAQFKAQNESIKFDNWLFGKKRRCSKCDTVFVTKTDFNIHRNTAHKLLVVS